MTTPNSGSELPKSLTLYKVDRHNRGVLSISFEFKRSVLDDNGECHIYYAECPYGDGQLTISLSTYKLCGYFEDAGLAHLKCLELQTELVEMAEAALKAQKQTLESIKREIVFFTPKSHH